MNSIKTALVSLVLLGVLYGMYQVLNAPPAQFDQAGYPQGAPEAPEISVGEAIDPSELGLGFASNSSDVVVESPSEPPGLVPDHDANQLPEAQPRSTPFPTTPSDKMRQGSTSRFADKPTPTPDTGGLDSTRPSIPGGSQFPGNTTGQLSDNTAPSQTNPPATAPNGLDDEDLTTTENPFFAGNSPQEQGRNEVLSSDSVSGRKKSSDEIADESFTQELSTAWDEVERMIEQEQFADALERLTYFYGDQRLSDEEDENLHTWLDALAAKVIYSTESFVDGPYQVREGDTLDSVAAAMQVPRELLFNINRDRISSLDAPLMGNTELKTIRGPFRGELDLSDETLTLFVGNRYAGRFDVRLNKTATFTPGAQAVANRSDMGKSTFLSDGTRSEAQSANNPYGSYVIELEQGLVIHEYRSTEELPPEAYIAVSPADIYDLYSILSIGSIVEIQE